MVAVAVLRKRTWGFTHSNALAFGSHVPGDLKSEERSQLHHRSHLKVCVQVIRSNHKTQPFICTHACSFASTLGFVSMECCSVVYV